MDWLLERQERIEKALARRHLTDDGFVLYDLSSQLCGGALLRAGGVGAQPRRQAGQAAGQLGPGVLARGSAGLGPGAPGQHRGPEHRSGCARHGQGTVRDRAGDPRRRSRDDHRRARRHAQRTRRRIRVGAQDRADPQADQHRRSPTVAVRSDQPRRNHLRRVPRRAARRVPQSSPRRRARPQTRGPPASDRARTRQGQADGRRAARHAAKRRRRQDRRSAPAALSTSTRSPNTSTLQIADGSFSYQRKTEQIDQEAALDGLYVLRTTCTTDSSPPRPSSAPTNS